MPTTTTTYSFNKPVVGADEDDWGGYLNGNWDSVDDLLDGTTPITGIDINSGTLDGVTIGGTTAGAGTFTTLTANTSITGTLATAAQTNVTSLGTLTGLTVSGSTSLAGASTSADITFGDNDKAIFGADSDLQIYHDGSNSYISDQGLGSLWVQATNLIVEAADGSNYLTAVDGGAVKLYYADGASNEKLATTSTGIDVTGTVTADGLTVEGLLEVDGSANGNVASVALTRTDASWSLDNETNFRIYGNTGDTTNPATKRMELSTNGDISFYEDTGTTAKFFWDASAENITINHEASSLNGLAIKNDTSTGITTGAGLTLHAHDGTSVNQIGGMFVSNSTWSYGTYSPKQLSITGSGSGGVRLATAVAPITFHTGNANAGLSTERMRIDSSGNVGIGTTSPSQKITVGFADNGTDGISFRSSSYANLAKILAENETSSQNGNLQFYTRSGGDVNEAMRINSSGNVGIGTSSPAVLSHVSAGYTAPTGGLDAGIRSLVSSTGYTGLGILSASNASSYVHFGDPDDSDVGGIIYGHSSNHMQINVNGTERMRIDSSGNVGIGTSSPTKALDVRSQAVVGNGTDGVKLTYSTSNSTGIIDTGFTSTGLEFRTGNSFAAKIDSSGKLNIGVSSYSGGYAGYNVMMRATSPMVKFESSSSNNTWDIYNNGGLNFIFAYNSSDKATISQSTGAYTALSDVNKKKDFENSNIGLEAVMQLQPKLFRMLDDASDAPKQLGFIAQEVQPIIPQAYAEITGNNKTFIGLQDRPIIAALTKALQEQQSIIAELEARITALENA